MSSGSGSGHQSSNHSPASTKPEILEGIEERNGHIFDQKVWNKVGYLQQDLVWGDSPIKVQTLTSTLQTEKKCYNRK